MNDKAAHMQSEPAISVKGLIISGLRGVRDIEPEIAGLLKDTLAIVGDVAKSAVAVTADVSAVLLGSVKAITKGIVAGVHEVGGDAMTRAHGATKGIVGGVSDIGTDIVHIARGAVGSAAGSARRASGSIMPGQQTGEHAATEREEASPPGRTRARRGRKR